MSQPPQTAKAVIAALADAFPAMPRALQTAARYIIDHPREVGVQSMRALAAGIYEEDPRLGALG